ncbi:MAG: methyltransferase domain-containing protein [Deltaproteobacteria bacterium]|nr:methyltransferase domain-containing protein [Deltaproteobacteria bacterium]
MGLIFDIHSAKRYESWYLSDEGKSFHKFIEQYAPLLLDPHPGEKILDIGCGSGRHLQFLSSLGMDITGVDASPYMINKAKERLGNRSVLKTGSAEDLPFEDNEFDLSVFMNTLEFLDDPSSALREAGRVTRRRIFIGVVNGFSWHRMKNQVLGLFRRPLVTHMKPLNLWELQTHITKVFGQVPMTWKSTPLFSPFFRRLIGFTPIRYQEAHCPFGPFLGIGLRIAYTLKTDNLPLKLKVNKAGQPVAGGITSVGNLK